MTHSNSRIRILYLLSGGVAGGIATGLAGLLRHLDRKRYEPIIATITRGPGEALLRQEKFSCTPLPPKNKLRALGRLIKQKQIHLVQSCDAAAEGAFASYLLGLPHIWFIGGSLQTTFAHSSPWTLKALKMFIRPLSHAVVVPSCSLAREEFPDLPAHKLYVIPWGVDIRLSSSQSKHGWLRQKLDFPPNGPLIAMIGNFYPAKRHLDFLQAASFIHRIIPQARFVIAGQRVGGPFSKTFQTSTCYRAKILQAIRRLKLEKVVKLSSFSVSERIAWIQEIDLLLCLSHEGMSQALQEAGACGVPIVAVNAGGNSEFIQDRLSGRLTPYRNPRASAQTAVELLRNPNLARKFGKALQRRVRAAFTAERQARRFEQLYERTIQTFKGASSSKRPNSQPPLHGPSNSSGLGPSNSRGFQLSSGAANRL